MGMVLVTLNISLNSVQSIIILEAQALSLSKIFLIASGALIPFHSLAATYGILFHAVARIAGNVNTFRSIIDKLNLVPFTYRQAP